MYIPKEFKNEDLASVKEFIAANGFGILVSDVNGRPWATHLPLILEESSNSKNYLSGHISKANKQWKEFDPDKEVMVVFSGPHSYVSSSWYDHENVPTWNYLAVHVCGKLRITEGEELKMQLSELVKKYEASLPNPVSIEKMSAEFIAKEMHGVIGFKIEITDIQAAAKLSQNRNRQNMHRIIDGLLQKGDPASVEMAKLLKEKNVPGA